jgi:hypothetical protein
VIEASRTLKKASRQGKRDPLKLLLRRVPAAFDEIAAGLGAYLRSHEDDISRPKSRASGRRAESEQGALVASEESLRREAALQVLRLLLLLYAGGRGLIDIAPLTRAVGGMAKGRRGEQDSPGRFLRWREFHRLLRVLKRKAGHETTGRHLSLLNIRPAGRRQSLEVPDAYLRRALTLLSLDSAPHEGSVGSAYTDLDVRGLGDAYELLMGLAAEPRDPGAKDGFHRRSSPRKTTGRYYTPQHIVDHIVRGALARRVRGLTSRGILNIRVLDPAVGSGHFLLGAADFLVRAYAAARALEDGAQHALCPRPASRGRYRRMIAARCLYGVDTDAVAVDVARYALWMEAGGGLGTMRSLKAHVKCGNALNGETFSAGISDPASWKGQDDCMSAPSATDARGAFHWQREFPDVAGRRRGLVGFDSVIGNPPYVSFSGRQKPRADGMRAFTTGRGDGKIGWPSAHGLFVLRATELINERGMICFIMPAQVGLLAGYASVRSGLLKVCDLTEVRYWGDAVFKNATTPALTFLATRRGAYRVDRCRLVVGDCPPRRFRPKDREPWYASAGRQALKRMAARHGTLATFSDPGVHTGNVAAKLLRSRRKAGSAPILEGRRILPFHCRRPARWLDLTYRPSAGEYFRAADIRTYKETDIIIRQTAARPVAARHSHRCRFRNSVLALKAPDGFSVEYLLGILNSDTAAMLYQALSPECLQRAFPQIKVNNLKQLPIPDPNLPQSRAVADRIESAVRVLEVRARDGGATGAMSARLNRLVREIYGLKNL